MSTATAVRIGDQRPRICHLAPGRVSSAGQEAIDLAASCGLILDDWQCWVLDHALSENAAGQWCATQVGLIVPRQAGKGSILEAVELAALFLFGEKLVVHSAHKFDTSQEHFLRMQSLIESNDELRAELTPHGFHRGSGKEQIVLRSGARLKFIARGRGSARGLTGDRIILDEAYDLPAQAIGAMIPALSARSMRKDSNPQVWYVSSAPHADSTVLHDVRQRGMTADDDARMFYAEWSNEPGVDHTDRDAWYRANPALGIRISEQWIAETEQAIMPPDEFARERLGIPDDPLLAPADVVDLVLWASLVDPGSLIVSHKSWALAVSPDRKWSSFGVAGRRSDGLMHVAWLERRAGTAWVVDVGAQLYEASKLPLRIHKSGPEGSFVVPLRERGVEVIEVSSAEVAASTGQFIDACNAGGLRHLGQASLDIALRGAVLRTLTDGAALWSQRNSSVEITPLMACTVAVGGVPASTDEKSVYVDRGMQVIG